MKNKKSALKRIVKQYKIYHLSENIYFIVSLMKIIIIIKRNKTSTISIT